MGFLLALAISVGGTLLLVGLALLHAFLRTCTTDLTAAAVTTFVTLLTGCGIIAAIEYLDGPPYDPIIRRRRYR
jgi:hypothetical protein